MAMDFGSIDGRAGPLKTVVTIGDDLTTLPTSGDVLISSRQTTKPPLRLGTAASVWASPRTALRTRKTLLLESQGDDYRIRIKHNLMKRQAFDLAAHSLDNHQTACGTPARP